MDGQNSILSVVGPLATSAASLKLAVQALLSQNPALYDPMVIEMPWRSSEEEAALSLVNANSGKGHLSFGLFKSDGIANPQPPVARAIDLTVAALKAAGHSIIEWDPPSHTDNFGFIFEVFGYDKGYDVYQAFGLSGEPASEQVQLLVGTGYPGKEASATDVAATNVAQRVAKKKYMDYWNSTAEKTGTGRPVDGIITPLAPYPAARPNMYKYYGYSAWVSFTSVDMLSVSLTTFR